MKHEPGTPAGALVRPVPIRTKAQQGHELVNAENLAAEPPHRTPKTGHICHIL